MISYGPLHMAKKKQGDQLEPTYSSSVRIRDVAQRTFQKRWTIGRGGGRGQGYPCWWHDKMMMMTFLQPSSLSCRCCLKYTASPLVKWVECSPMVRETRVQSLVESYQRLKKWYLMPPCLALKVCIKGNVEQSRDRSCTLPDTSV